MGDNNNAMNDGGQGEFEKVMDGELEPPMDDGTLSDVTGEQEGVPPPGEQDSGGESESSKDDETSTVDIKALQERIDALERESAGRLKGLRAEREQRKALEAKVATVVDLVSKSKSAKQQAGSDNDVDDETVSAGGKKIPVSFDDDGNPYIDPDDLIGLTKRQISSVEKQLASKVEQVEQSQQANTAQTENAKAVESVLSRDAAFPAAYAKLNQAFKMLDEGMDRIVARSDIDPASLTIDQCLELMESDATLMKNFKAQFPTIDIDTVVEAMALSPAGRVNTRKLSKALSALKSKDDESADGDTGGKQKKGIGKTLKTITSARNLAGATNQKGSRDTSLDDIASLTTDDFLSLTDAQVKEIEKVLLQEELAEA